MGLPQISYASMVHAGCCKVYRKNQAFSWGPSQQEHLFVRLKPLASLRLQDERMYFCWVSNSPKGMCLFLINSFIFIIIIVIK